MTRDEFLGRLGELLACLPAEQVEETKAFYAEAIADRMEDGMSEEEAVAAMGAPGEVAKATLDDLPAVPRAIARTRRRSTALLWVDHRGLPGVGAAARRLRRRGRHGLYLHLGAGALRVDRRGGTRGRGRS